MKHTTKIILPVLLLLLLAVLQNPAKASEANTAKKVFTVNLTEDHPYEYYLIVTQRKKPYAKYYADVSVKILEMSGKPDDKVIDTLIYYQAEDSKGSLEYDFDAKKYKKGAVLGKHKLWGWEGLTFNLPKGVKQVKYQITISSKYKVIQRCTEEESESAFFQWRSTNFQVEESVELGEGTKSEAAHFAVGSFLAMFDYDRLVESKSFESSNNKVAEVNKDGMITAKKAGKCTVTTTIKYRESESSRTLHTKKYETSVTVVNGKKDAAELIKIIRQQQKQGAKMKGDLFDEQYTWSGNKLTGILWYNCGVKGSLSFGKLTSLKHLTCRSEKLKKLDVSKNRKLEGLDCDSSQLKSLDVSKNAKLKSLSCDSNKLKNLDIRKNRKLEGLYCSSNQLKKLDISKNTKLKDLHCGSNHLKSLDISKNAKLESLYCGSNQLESLDISKKTGLKELSCGSNPLKSLDVSKNRKLEELYCGSIRLKSLDVSKNSELRYLSCNSNQLKSLDVSKNVKLKSLSCNSNQLKSLDVSKNTELMDLDCSSNQLAGLDISNNIKLRDLDCRSNLLESLDISKNPKLGGLFGPQVDENVKVIKK